VAWKRQAPKRPLAFIGLSAVKKNAKIALFCFPETNFFPELVYSRGHANKLHLSRSDVPQERRKDRPCLFSNGFRSAGL
jgi:hypothetical protein